MTGVEQTVDSVVWQHVYDGLFLGAGSPTRAGIGQTFTYDVHVVLPKQNEYQTRKGNCQRVNYRVLVEESWTYPSRIQNTASDTTKVRVRVFWLPDLRIASKRERDYQTSYTPQDMLIRDKDNEENSFSCTYVVQDPLIV